jgi:prepilin-type N-terminal cleavage/methylation domain-containing protein
MRKAFTLIELLVVIAIISILAGMLMPALERARQEARKAACIANVKNVGNYLAIFKEDHNGWPRATEDGEDIGFDVGGDTGIVDSSLTIARIYSLGYAETQEIFVCPNTNHEELMRGLDVANNYDNDGNTTEHRFDSLVSADCDPSYVMDPRVPFNPYPGRAVYADGPDMARVRHRYRQVASLDLDEVRDENANHPNGAVTLFADSAVLYLIMNEGGFTRNTRMNDTGNEDVDIYEAEDYAAGVSIETGERYDCILGTWNIDYDSGAETANQQYRDDVAVGPTWDRN